ncbi:ArdC-like ssDNA-binding domain-containing protein [Desulfobacter sp.]|uniref:ArdC-like ssDNA-binding domain-containing protein n=1 Tax=Desulfobacter sp. TaxID=2294 RepID=UPI003D14F62F
MNKNIQAVLQSIVSAFESGDIPDAVAVASFPIPDIPSTQWSFTNRTIQFLSGTADARGFNQWKTVHRHVKKGAKAVYILVPCFRRQQDEETEEEQQVLTFFKAMPVFRVEDTEGLPLDYQNIELPELPLLQRAYDWEINVKAVPGNYRYYGYFSPARKEIALATPSEKTFFHELSHTADFIIKGNLKAGQDPFQEITAELSAQALSRIAGKSIEDTTGNSFRYISHYAKKVKMSPEKACLKVLSDCEKILNLILHGRADGIENNQKVA